MTYRLSYQALRDLLAYLAPIYEDDPLTGIAIRHRVHALLDTIASYPNLGRRTSY